MMTFRVLFLVQLLCVPILAHAQPAILDYPDRFNPKWCKAGASVSELPPPATISFTQNTIIDELLSLSDNDVVDCHGNTLILPKSLTEILGEGLWGKDPGHMYAWSGGIIEARDVSNIVIRDCRIALQSPAFSGHWDTEGFNAFFIKRSHNIRFENVEIVDADNGIQIEDSYNITGRNITFNRTRSGWYHTKYKRVYGHHGIALKRVTGALFVNTTWNYRFVHDYTISSGADGNVLTDVTAYDFIPDFHRGAPSGNLIDNVQSTKIRRFWRSGGSKSKGPHNGPDNVLWNIHEPDGDWLERLPTIEPGEWIVPLTIVGHQRPRIDGDLWVEADTQGIDSLYDYLKTGNFCMGTIPDPIPTPDPVPVTVESLDVRVTILEGEHAN